MKGRNILNRGTSNEDGAKVKDSSILDRIICVHYHGLHSSGLLE